MRKSLLLSLVLVVVLSTSLCLTSCSTDNKDKTNQTNGDSTKTDSTKTNDDSAKTDSTKPDDVDLASLTGEVTVAVPSWEVGNTEELLGEYFPSATVTVEAADPNLTEYLTTKAAAGDLPQVIGQSWDRVPYFISQGWVYNLEELFSADPESQYVPSGLTDLFRYNGDLYILPDSTNWNVVFVNLDLLATLNEDPPSYDWTWDECVRLMKKATTAEYSGCRDWDEIFDMYYCAGSENLWDDCYDASQDKWIFTNGIWSEAINEVKELKAIKGLFANTLKNKELTDTGKMDDYQKKFGKDADAFEEGKILMDFGGTWEMGNTYDKDQYNWDIYPFPVVSEELGIRTPIHSNYSFMTTNVDDSNLQLSYEVLKFLSYGKVGSLARLERLQLSVDSEGNPDPFYFIPSTRHPEVIEIFKSAKGVPDGMAWMFANLPYDLPRGDTKKGVPKPDDAFDAHLETILEDMFDGKVDPDSVAKDIEEKVNTEYKTVKAELEKVLE